MKAAPLLALLGLFSCTTTVTRVTAPDGTVTETRVTAPDAASVQAAGAAALAFAPRARVLSEK